MSLEAAGALVALALGVLALLGLFYRYVLLPQLDDRFARVDNSEAIERIKTQVTENHHSNAEPTLLDRLDDVKTELREDVSDLKQDIKLLVSAYDGRIKLTEAWMDRTEDALAHLSTEITRVWTEVDLIKQQVNPPAS